MALRAADVRAALRSAADTLAWLVHPREGRFMYTAADAHLAHAAAAGGAHPRARAPTRAAACPLRELGTVAVAGALLRACEERRGGEDCIAGGGACAVLAPAVATTLAAYAAAVTWHDVAPGGQAAPPAEACHVCVDDDEPPSVAHAGTLAAALAAAPRALAPPHAPRLLAALAEGLAAQQRPDGTFKARAVASRGASAYNCMVAHCSLITPNLEC
jgi:hypothetical protein